MAGREVIKWVGQRRQRPFLDSYTELWPQGTWSQVQTLKCLVWAVSARPLGPGLALMSAAQAVVFVL